MMHHKQEYTVQLLKVMLRDKFAVLVGQFTHSLLDKQNRLILFGPEIERLNIELFV